MNAIDASCPRCGRPLHVPTEAVLLDRGTTGTRAWLVCSGCDQLVWLAVPETVVPALVRDGCHVVAADPPAHPEQRPEGPALEADDVLALHELLADDDALAAALRGLAPLDEQPS